ncbi:MAG: hypothetical protein IT159_14895 [Bryobacterales bacterium]|nr:hypothetical protein [Bryobacterales bacterium]
MKRVLSRLACSDTGLPELAAKLLDRRDPGRYNQALMELGATVCLPGAPECPRCPVSAFCEAKLQGREAEFPAKRARPATVRVTRTLLVAQRGAKLLLSRRKDFWELPGLEQAPGAEVGAPIGRFRHSVMNRSFHFTVVSARVRKAPPGCRWVAESALARLPVSAVLRKALGLRNSWHGSLVNRLR